MIRAPGLTIEGDDEPTRKKWSCVPDPAPALVTGPSTLCHRLGSFLSIFSFGKSILERPELSTSGSARRVRPGKRGSSWRESVCPTPEKLSWVHGGRGRERESENKQEALPSQLLYHAESVIFTNNLLEKDLSKDRNLIFSGEWACFLKEPGL